MADTKLSALTELAATPADNDEVYIRDVSEIAADESKRITVANLITGAGAPTKEFYIPVTVAASGGVMSYTAGGRHPVALLNGSGEWAFVSFLIPNDFNSIAEAVMIVIPSASQASADWDFHSHYIAIGENRTASGESNTGSTYNVTDDVLFEVDISGILSAIAVGDIVGLLLIQGTAGHDVDVVGVRFKYS